MQTSSSREETGYADIPGFERAVERYYQPLYRFAFSLTHSEADACDLTQQTFYTLSAKGGQLRDAAKMKSWLFSTMHRAFLQTLRQETRVRLWEQDDTNSQMLYVLPERAIRLDAADALQALGKIDEPYRISVALFYLEDCPYKEIARLLGVPIGTVKSRIARGLSQLKKLLVPPQRRAGPSRVLAVA